MKLLTVIAMLIMSMVTFSDAGKEGGGGDSGEILFHEIRLDILNWIERGGSEKLKFSEKITLEKYNTKMTEALQEHKVTVSFTKKDIYFGGKLKTCRWSVSYSREFEILCNEQKFQNSNINEQYKLVHHEFAGIAGIEKSKRGSSTYVFSNQISAFLKSKIVKRLAIKNHLIFETGREYYPQVISRLCSYDVKRPDIVTLFNSETGLREEGIGLLGRHGTRFRSRKMTSFKFIDDGNLESRTISYSIGTDGNYNELNVEVNMSSHKGARELTDKFYSGNYFSIGMKCKRLGSNELVYLNIFVDLRDINEYKILKIRDM